MMSIRFVAANRLAFWIVVVISVARPGHPWQA
jgi:hypothetical protein